MKSRFSLLLAVTLFVLPVMVIADTTATINLETKDPVTPVTPTEQPQTPAAPIAPVTPDTKNPVAPVTPDAKNSVAPVTPETKNSVAPVTTEAKAGIIATITGLLAAGRTNVSKGLDTVAKYSFNPILTKLASFDCLKGGKFQNSIPTINRVLVSAAAVTVLYAAYKVYKGQQDTSEDFDTDFDVDNN